MSYTIDTQDFLPWAVETVVCTSKRPNSSDVTETVTNAGATQVSNAEAAKSNGVYVNGDAKFEFSSTAPAFELKPRDSLVWGGNTYIVQRAVRDSFLNCVQVDARNFVMAADLRQTATVLRPDPEPNATGMRIPNLSTEYTDEPCRLQPLTRSREWATGGGERTRKAFECYFLTAVELEAGDVILVDGVRYEFTEQDSIEQLGDLTVASCERVD